MNASIRIALAAAASLAVGCASVPQPVREWATTDDGWKLAIHHYAPAKPDPTLHPVILCHGIGLNHRFWDVTPEMSFARHLTDLGFDVWVPAVRGNGDSERHGASALHASMMFSRPQRLADAKAAGATQPKPDGGDYTIDDHLVHDLPAIIAHVKKATGSAKVSWVGHSMGGMIILGALERFPRDDIAAAVTVGSPTVLVDPISVGMALLAKFEGIVIMLNGHTSLGELSRLGGLTAHRVPNPIDSSYFHVPNVDRGLLAIMNRSVYEDVSAGVMHDLAVLCRTKKWLSTDEKFDYSAHLENVKAPTLFVVGSVDAVASPDSVRHGFDRIASKEKKFVLAGPADGSPRDYGHCDLILGLHARRETWPVIVDWLRKHGSVGR